ncbi:MAG: DUF4255 domain-containing protein [Nitrospirae bacterium]|nr:DUF4255 domain-containing protein [Nitrospirota bacterium]
MIDKVLDVMKTGIQEYLVRLPELNITSETVVHITPVVKPNGDIAVPDNSLGLTLVNVEEERVVKAQKSSALTSGGQVVHMNPDVKINLYLLITANFSKYGTGLGFLSGAVRFFQAKNVFNHDNTPGLHPDIEKLTAELFTLSFEQQNHLWGSLGAKYLPSVLYKIRMITIQEAALTDEQPPVGTVGISGRGIRTA